jgi:hypothetical protein
MMPFTGLITYVGDVKDGEVPLMGPKRPKVLSIEVGSGTGPGPIQAVLEISQDAALELVAKLTQLLKARGCL